LRDRLHRPGRVRGDAHGEQRQHRRRRRQGLLSGRPDPLVPEPSGPGGPSSARPAGSSMARCPQGARARGLAHFRAPERVPERRMSWRVAVYLAACPLDPSNWEISCR
jgi:hypothetical protein